MNCPKCGNRLEWDDGAFCKLCMDIANEKSRQLQIAKKAANKSLEPTIKGRGGSASSWIAKTNRDEK